MFRQQPTKPSPHISLFLLLQLIAEYISLCSSHYGGNDSGLSFLIIIESIGRGGFSAVGSQAWKGVERYRSFRESCHFLRTWICTRFLRGSKNHPRGKQNFINFARLVVAIEYKLATERYTTSASNSFGYRFDTCDPFIITTRLLLSLVNTRAGAPSV